MFRMMCFPWKLNVYYDFCQLILSWLHCTLEVRSLLMSTSRLAAVIIKPPSLLTSCLLCSPFLLLYPGSLSMANWWPVTSDCPLHSQHNSHFNNTTRGDGGYRLSRLLFTSTLVAHADMQIALRIIFLWFCHNSTLFQETCWQTKLPKIWFWGP